MKILLISYYNFNTALENQYDLLSLFLGKYKNQVLDNLNKIPEYVNKVLPQKVLNTNTGKSIKYLFIKNYFTIIL